jgi:hypothetical protein
LDALEQKMERKKKYNYPFLKINFLEFPQFFYF